MRGEMELKAELAEVPRARAYAREQLRHWDRTNLVDVAELVVTELVSNAVEHTGAPVRLRLGLTEAGRTVPSDRGALRVEVADADTTPPQRRHADSEHTTGRGLELVELLSRRWGWHPDADGKTVWCDLD